MLIILCICYDMINMTLYFCGLPPRNLWLRLIKRKTSDKSQLRDILPSPFSVAMTTKREKQCENIQQDKKITCNDHLYLSQFYFFLSVLRNSDESNSKTQGCNPFLSSSFTLVIEVWSMHALSSDMMLPPSPRNTHIWW